VCVSFSRSLCVLSVCHSVFLSLSPSMCTYLFISLSLSVARYMSLSLSLFLSLCLPLAPLCVYVGVCFSRYASVSFYLCLAMCVCFSHFSTSGVHTCVSLCARVCAHVCMYVYVCMHHSICDACGVCGLACVVTTQLCAMVQHSHTLTFACAYACCIHEYMHTPTVTMHTCCMRTHIRNNE